jgi:hypothetical protein
MNEGCMDERCVKDAWMDEGFSNNVFFLTENSPLCNKKTGVALLHVILREGGGGIQKFARMRLIFFQICHI